MTRIPISSGCVFSIGKAAWAYLYITGHPGLRQHINNHHPDTRYDIMKAVNSGGKGWSMQTMEILCGGEVPKKVPALLDLIAATIDDPRTLINNAERIATDPGIKDYRFHLVRIQIHSELNMRENVDKYTVRLWASQTLERLAFGDLKLEGSKRSEDDDD
jgi:hypothetical protein